MSSAATFSGLFSNNSQVDLYALFGTKNLLTVFTNSNYFWVVFTDGINTYFSSADYNVFDATQPFSTPVLIAGLEPGITLRAISRDIQSNALAIAYNNDQLIFVDVSDGTYIHKEGLFTDLDFSDGAYIQFSIGNQGVYSTSLFVTARNPVTKKYFIELYSDDLYSNTDHYFDTVPDIRSPIINNYYPHIRFVYGTIVYGYYQYGSYNSYTYGVHLPINVDTYRSIIFGLGRVTDYAMLSATTNTIYINLFGYPYIIPVQTVNLQTQFIPIGYQTLISDDGPDVVVYLTDGILYILLIPNNIRGISFLMNTGDPRGLSGLNARLTGSNIPGTDFVVGLEYNTIYNIYDTDTPNTLYVSDPIVDDNILVLYYGNTNTSLVMTVEALNYAQSPFPMTNETLTDPVLMTGTQGFHWINPDLSDGTYYFTPGKYLYTDIINILNGHVPIWSFAIRNRTLTTEATITNPSCSIGFFGGLDKIVGTASILGPADPYTAPYPLGNKEVWSIVDTNDPNQLILEQTAQPFPSQYETLTVVLKGNSLNTQLDGVYSVTMTPFIATFDPKYNFSINGTAPFGTLSFSYTDPISRNLSLPTRLTITAPPNLDGTVSFAVSDTIMDLIKFANLERRMVRVEQVTMIYSDDSSLGNPIGVQILCPEFINTYTYDQLQNVDYPLLFTQSYQNPMYYFSDSFTIMNGYVLPTTIRTNGLVHFSLKLVLPDGSIVDAPSANLTLFKFTLCVYVR
jgi:hypothetical protein